MSYNLSTRKYLLLGHLCMAVLFVMAVFFANERVLLTDSAYQIFYDINNGGMLINDSRYSMVLTQLLPWLAIHLHLPLRLVVISYSVSFVLVGYTCWLVTAYGMKQHNAATLMLFVLLAIGGTFLHCISESFQLMFYVPMLYAWMCKGDDKKAFTYYAVLALFVALAFFIYPMSVFYILFAVGFRLFKGDNAFRFTLASKQITLNRPALITLALLALYIILYWLIGPSGHDSEFVPTWDVVRQSLLHFSSLGSFTVFRNLFLQLYLVPILLLALTLLGYIRSRRWRKALFVGGYAIAFFVSSCIIYQVSDSLISRERYFIPLFFIVGLAFLEDELPRFTLWQQRCFYVAFIALMALSFVRIHHYVRLYQPRMEAIAEVTRQADTQGQHKLIVTRSNAEQLFPLDIWGLALGSMLYSAQQGPEHTVTIYKEEDDFDRSDANLYDNPDCYIAVNWWKQWWVKELNPHYFSLPAQGYKELLPDTTGYRFADL